VPVGHVLDNWSGYARRRLHDGLPMLEPDLDAVMDEDARLGAIADGVPEKCLRVAGHPGLGELAWLKPVKNDIFVVVLPHPKDDAAALEKLWRGISCGVPGLALQLPQRKIYILPAADAVSGMASILLYDA
jgi:hypothetical protein